MASATACEPIGRCPALGVIERAERWCVSDQAHLRRIRDGLELLSEVCLDLVFRIENMSWSILQAAFLADERRVVNDARFVVNVVDIGCLE